MYSNFNFLQKDWGSLAKIGQMAEYNLYKDPNTSIFKLRQFGEELVKIILKMENINFNKSSQAFEKINTLKNYGLIPKDIEIILNSLRTKGNKAAHGTYGDEETAETLLSLSVKIAAWFQEVYGTDLNFEAGKIEYKKPENINYEAEYLKLFEKTEEIQKELENIKIDTSNRRTKEERKKLINSRKEVELTESETRYIIDMQLRNAGWEVDTLALNYKLHKTLPEKKKNMAIAEWPCTKEDGRRGYADYALFCGEELYGVIEAKRKDIDIPTALNNDSRIYAKGIEIYDLVDSIGNKIESLKFCENSPFGEYKVPFMFASNGREYNKDLPEKSGIWFLDGRNKKNLPKPLKGFYSPKNLKELLEKDKDEANKKLSEESFEYFENKFGLNLRYYQIEAIKTVEEALIRGQKNVLLTMATGTGKTMTALGLIYRLLKSNKYKRILFVVDRKTLGKQAGDTFKEVRLEQQQSLDKIFGVNLFDKSEDLDSRLHIVTIQSLIKRILETTQEDKLSPAVGDYDCIIIDEAHRGYILDRELSDEEAEFFDEKDFLGKYRAVVEYFDADKIGLTATPALHTREIFGDPVYSYTYTKAVIDGYLVDAEPFYQITTKLSEEGIHYEKGAQIKLFDDDEKIVKVEEVLEDELNFDVENFNKSVITENFNRAVCSALVDVINPEGPEKTLIFAASDEHADMIVRILREEYQKQNFYDMNADMIVKITGYVKDVDQLIKKFKNENFPTIVVTVDLLTTGVDVPKICNLVFLRKVKSRILYHQMLGRATRKCDKIGKESFKVFDAVKNYSDMRDYSDMNPVVNNPQIDIEKLFDNYRKDVSKEAQDYFISQILARLQRKKQTIKSLGDEKFKINSKRFRNEEMENIEDYVEFIKNTDYSDLNKEEDFLTYLDNIKAPKKERIISEHSDEVREVTQIYGANQKPEDYLESFQNFIKEKADEIESLKLLKENPKIFTRKNLKELKEILDEFGYKETGLNSAYKQVKNVNITADILEYIKNVLKGSPVVDKEEKINDVKVRIKKLKNWNPKQQQMIDIILNLLKQNEYLTKEDFETTLIFRDKGGYKQIDKLLEEFLGQILEIINEEIILN